MIKCSHISFVSRIKAPLGALQTAKLFVSEVIIPYLLRCKKPGFADLAAKLRMKSSKGFFCDNRRELRLLYHNFIARSAMGGAAAGAIAQIMIKCSLRRPKACENKASAYAVRLLYHKFSGRSPR